MRSLIADPRDVTVRSIVNDTGFLYTIPQQNIASGPVHLQSPTPTPSDVAGIAEQFVHARLAARALPQYPGVGSSRSRNSVSLPGPCASRTGRTPSPAGRSRAFLRRSRPSMPKSGWSARSSRPTFTSQRAGRTIECPVFEGGFAAVEAEIVICVGRDAPRDKVDWTLDEAADFVGELCIGVEIASSPLATLNELGAGRGRLGFRQQLGRHRRRRGAATGARWTKSTVHSFIDDEFVGRGATSMRHGPLGALAFTLGQVRASRPPAAGRRRDLHRHDHRRARHPSGPAFAPRVPGLRRSRMPRSARHSRIRSTHDRPACGCNGAMRSSASARCAPRTRVPLQRSAATDC